VKDETRSIKTLQKAVLSHAKAMRWILASLDGRPASPAISLIRVTRYEVTIVLKESGILHGPDYETLHGYAGKKRRKYEPGQVENPENLVLEHPAGGQIIRNRPHRSPVIQSEEATNA
jgi:hypothetical protein